MGTIADKLNYTQTSVSSIRNAIKQKNDAYVIDSPLADAAQAILDISGGGGGGTQYETIDGDCVFVNNRFYLPRKEKPIFCIFYPSTNPNAVAFIYDTKLFTDKYYNPNTGYTTLADETDTRNANFMGYSSENGMFARFTSIYISEKTYRYRAIFENKESRMTEMRTAIGAKATATAVFNFEVKAALIFWNASTTAGYYEPLRSHPNAEAAYKDENGMTLWVFRGNVGSNTTAPTTDGIFIDGNTVSVRYGTQGNSNCFICAFNYVPDEIKKAVDG